MLYYPVGGGVREITEGFESGDAPANGWVQAAGSSLRANTGSINKDTSLNGGLWALTAATNARLTSPVFPSGPIREGWVRVYAQQSATNSWAVVLQDGGTDQVTVVMQGASLTIEIRRGAVAGTLLATSGGTIVSGSWHRIDINFYIDDAAGFIKVYVDDPGTYTTPFVQATGVDTNNAGANRCDRFSLLQPTGSAARYDDVGVNSLSLSYDAGSGTTPTPLPATITGGTSGATAIVTALGPGTTVAAGRLIVRGVTGTFVDNETITGGGLTASVNAPNGTYVGGLEPNSGPLGPGFIVYLTPNANGTLSQLLGTDSNQVDNYLLVDDNPIDALTDGVVGDTDGETDLYGLSDLPASAQSVNFVQVGAYAFKDGVAINKLNAAIRTGGTTYQSAPEFDANVAASAAMYKFPFPLNPNTGGQWTVSEVNAIEAGPRVKA